MRDDHNAKTLKKRMCNHGHYDIGDISGSGLRFAFSNKRVTAFDDMGDTATEVILNVLKTCKNETLTALWGEITEAE